MKNYLTAFFCAITMLASSCSQPAEEKEKDKIKSAADSFTENYFNFKFADSRKFSTEESAVWLSFLASNMQQEDIDILKAQDEGAYCEAQSINIVNDTTATANYRIHNFMRIDTLGKAGEMTEQADYIITLVKRGGKWNVKMEGPLQSERRNRD